MIRWLLVCALVLAGCEKPTAAVDPQLASEIAGIKAIDNHAHPVRPTAAGEKPDDEYDALPVESLEAASDPVRTRPGSPVLLEAHRAIFGGDKAGAQKTYGQDYAVRVLDQLNIETMLANRVAVGPGLPSPRFLWVPFADALMYPLPTDALVHNSDQKEFFALEAKLLARYYAESGVASKPATLDEYLEKVVARLFSAKRTAAPSPRNSRWRICVRLPSAIRRKPTPKKSTPPAPAITARCRTTFSASSPPNADGWVWRCISIPARAAVDISTSVDPIPCCWNRCSTIPRCAKPIS